MESYLDELPIKIRQFGSWIMALVSPGQELHRSVVLALWHHVGPPPQVTHFHLCHVMKERVPFSNKDWKQQLEKGIQPS